MLGGLLDPLDPRYVVSGAAFQQTTRSLGPSLGFRVYNRVLGLGFRVFAGQGGRAQDRILVCSQVVVGRCPSGRRYLPFDFLGVHSTPCQVTNSKRQL